MKAQGISSILPNCITNHVNTNSGWLGAPTSDCAMGDLSSFPPIYVWEECETKCLTTTLATVNNNKGPITSNRTTNVKKSRQRKTNAPVRLQNNMITFWLHIYSCPCGCNAISPTSRGCTCTNQLIFIADVGMGTCMQPEVSGVRCSGCCGM